MSTQVNLMQVNFMQVLMRLIPPIMCAVKYFKQGEKKFLISAILFGASLVLLIIPLALATVMRLMVPVLAEPGVLKVISFITQTLSALAHMGAIVVLAKDFLGNGNKFILIGALFGASLISGIILNAFPSALLLSIISTLSYIAGLVLLGVEFFSNHVKFELAVTVICGIMLLFSNGFAILRSIININVGEIENVHQHESTPVEEVGPTCTQAGYIKYICKYCGEDEQISYIADALGHDYQSNVVKPTCTTNGYTVYSCTRNCGESYISDNTMPLDHNYRYIETIEPTCTSIGYTVYGCINGCNDQYIDNELPAAPHEYGNWRETVIANCYAEGKKTRTCKHCPATETEVIPITHIEAVLPGEPASIESTGLTEGSYCEKCYEILVDQVEIPKMIQWEGQTISSFAGGNGTMYDPYLISTPGQLAYLASAINSSDSNVYYDKYYELTCNINLNGAEWDPIGCYYTSTNGKSDTRVFSGHFDGNNYTVSNFKITSPKTSYYKLFGLFGQVNGSIDCLNVDGAKINLSSSSYAVGALAGDIEGTMIYDCRVINSSIEGTVLTAGMLAGESGATLKECSIYSSCKMNVDETPYVGGLVGFNLYNIESCSSWAEVNGLYGADKLYIGGLVGYNSAGKITQSSGLGNIYGKNSAFINGHTYVGGLVGYILNGSIDKCYTQGTVKVEISGYDTTAYAGGIAGEVASDSTISNSKSTAKINAYGNNTVYCGGFVGLNRGKINNSYSTGMVYASVSEYVYVGGFVGSSTVNNGLNNCIATGDITVNKTSDSVKAYASRFVGGGVAVNNCYVLKTQTLTGASENNTYWQEVTASQMKTKVFYVTTLGWSEDDWDMRYIANGNVMPYRVKT